MSLKKIITELREKAYLSEKETEILKALAHEELSAKAISKKTKIPLGRIYEPLNWLIEEQLIKKSGKKPAKYGFDNPQEAIMKFFKKKFDNFVKDESRVLEMLEEKDSPQISILKSKQDFTHSLIKCLSSCKTGLRTIARDGSLPFIFYPSNKKDFVKFRNLINRKRTTIAHTTEAKAITVFNAYQDALKKGKYFRAMCNEKTFLWHINLIKEHLGEEFLEKMLTDFKDKCKKYDIKLYIIKEYLPMQVFIIHNKIVLFHIHLGLGSGIDIQNKETVVLYKGMFEGMKKRSKTVEYYLRKF
jgi:hypothetical protein